MKILITLLAIAGLASCSSDSSSECEPVHGYEQTDTQLTLIDKAGNEVQPIDFSSSEC